MRTIYCFALALGIAAQASPENSKAKPAFTDGYESGGQQWALTQEQAALAIQALTVKEPRIAQFAEAFPGIPAHLYRIHGPKEKFVRVEIDVRLNEQYVVDLWLDAWFSLDYTTVIEHKIAAFCASDEKLIRETTGLYTAIRPLRLKIEDMDDLCAAPLPYIQKRYQQWRASGAEEVVRRGSVTNR